MQTLLLVLALAAAQDAPRSGIAAWDTLASSAEPLAPEAFERKSGWKPLETGAAPQGDAVISNGKILAVARKQGTGLELYSLLSGKPVYRSRLLVAPGGPLEKISASDIGRGAAALELSWKGAAVRFRLPKGELFVESQALTGEAPLRIECPGRFVVLPDFFADDILVDARKLPLDRVELPSENFVLHFAGAHDAIIMGVFENREQDVQVTMTGKGDQRSISGSEISFGKKGNKIWVSLLEGAGLWHSIDVGDADKEKIIPLEWKMPFVAQWRVDFTRKEGLTDSWDMLLPDKEGDGFIKPSWLAQDGKISDATRTATGEVDRDAYKPGGPASDRLGPDRNRWTTVLGKVQYPCWSDKEQRGFLQPLKHKRLAFDGPVLIYPVNRLAETPVAAYTAVDVMRNTLGVGPCQHLLDVEGQKQEHVGRATCHVRTLLTETYTAGTQKGKRKEIEAWLGDALDFVTHIRKRILMYVDFGKDFRKYLAEQKKAHPELKESIDSLDAIAGEIDLRVGAGMERIRKHPTLSKIAEEVAERKEEPTPPALAAQLNRDFLAKGLQDYEKPDWKDQLKKEYTDPLTAIGGSQDDMVGECRWVVKALRQKAGILMATEPKMAPMAAEIRTWTQKILRGGAAYEGARH
ncbi:MAG: hypothetical protein HY293_19740 [Planctomycetes bacterium]|nr:hypothetical protein [Planctomycetota bacterium]